MSSRYRFVGACAAALVLTSVVASLSFADDSNAPELRYQFKPDQKIGYSIKIEAELPDSKETLSGNVFFTVKSIDEGTGNATLAVTSALAPHPQPKPAAGHNGPRTFASPFNDLQFNAPRQIVINEQGKVVKNNGESQIPLLLGNVWQLVFEPLPTEAKNSWDQERPIEISSKHGRVWGMSPMMNAMGNTESNSSAQINSHYTLEPSSGDVQNISKKYELTTDEKNVDGPELEQKGEGHIVFDTQLGLIKSSEMKIDTHYNRDNISVRIPTTISIQLLSEDVAEKETAKRDEAQAAAMEKAKDRLTPKPLAAAEINVALLELKDRDLWTVRKACERFEKTPPVETYRKQVAKALEPLLNDRDHFIRIDAAKALGVWGTKDNVEALNAVANDSDPFVKEAVKDSLVSIYSNPKANPAKK